jgi:hypothetical protein
MVIRSALALAAFLIASTAHAAPTRYLVVCTAPCTAPDGTTQPVGTALNRVLADPAQFNPGDGLSLVADDGRAIYAPPAPAITPAQRAAATIAAGVQITSTGTPALSGTYPADPATTSEIQAEMISLLVNGVFADGATTVQWIDTSGTPHTFTAPQWKSLATAIGQFVAAWTKYGQGLTTTAPASTATIP